MKKGVLAAVLVVLSATASPRATHPEMTWTAGDYYFKVDGISTLTVSANPYGLNTPAFPFTTAFQQAAQHGTRIVRIHVTNHFNFFKLADDRHDDEWIEDWELIFEEAETYGLYVLPVLDVWANWNLEMDAWNNNVFNVNSEGFSCTYPDERIDCGPADDPSDLLFDTAEDGTREQWLDHIEYLVAQWMDNDNIIGWEVFSELDLIEGHDREAGCPVVDRNVELPCPVVQLFEAAAARIRGLGDLRPITASTAGVNDMPALWDSDYLDWAQIHPYSAIYPYQGSLDQLILDKVRLRRSLYGKPVLIGEGGLDTLFDDKEATLTLKLRSPVGINQAIWAAAVSGAMNARALWFEDGYDDGLDICATELGAAYASEAPCLDPDDEDILTLREVYYDAAQPVVNFTAGVDYTGFVPLTLMHGDILDDDLIDGAGDLLGAALGDGDMMIGWVRDIQSDAPLCPDPTPIEPCTYDPADHWPWRDLAGQRVKIAVPNAVTSDDWVVEFWNTETGNLLADVDVPTDLEQDADGSITFELPLFQGSIAFKIYPVEPLVVELDITPRFPRHNNMNLQFRRGFGVIILNTFVAGDPAQGFDATIVDASSVRVGPLGAAPVRSELLDFQQDGDDDLVMGFRMDDPGFPCGDSELVLTGETNTGRSIVGSGPIRVIGCGGP